MEFASRMKNLESSGIRRMFELASKMKDPVDLSIGQPDFQVPELIQEAAIQAIRDGKNRYTMTTGIEPLKEATLEALHEEGVKAEGVMMTAGASGGLMLSLLALADESVEVLVPDPCFVTYGHLVRMTGATPRWVDTYPDFRLTPGRLEKAITPKSRMMIFNSPVNPTGVAYTAEEVKLLAEVTKRHKIQVISDEVYDTFCYDYPHESWLKHDPNALLVRAFSKNWAMPGWRIGFTAGPQEILEQMAMLQQFSFVCINTPAQWACLAGLKQKVQGLQETYREKRDLMVDGLAEAFSFQKPRGAFYIFPEFPGGDAKSFMAKCIEHEILVVPGKAFSPRNTHFRVSFATDKETIKRGVDILVGIAKR